jgi:hypothetical protein
VRQQYLAYRVGKFAGICGVKVAVAVKRGISDILDAYQSKRITAGMQHDGFVEQQMPTHILLQIN